MRYILLPLLCLLQIIADASVPLKVSDEELADKSDHVFVAHVVGVDMIDAKGRQVTDKEAKTGPGLENTIRLKVQIDETLITNKEKVPKHLYIPLDSFMHYSLGQVIKAHSGKNPKFLLLLSGEKMLPPVAGIFRRSLESKDYFVRRVTARQRKTK